MNIAIHDLKEPAANVSLISDLILKKVPENEPVVELVGMMQFSISDIRERLDSLLNLSQIENGDIKLNIAPVDLASLLGQVKSNFVLQAQQKRQEIKLDAPANVVVNIDKGRIKEVFENLLSNAIKYSYENADITIYLRKQNEAVMVEFRDNGQGLHEEDMRKLFTKFSKLSAVPTGKERSNGLGLSIVKTLVELHQGKVWAKSAGKDKGASFFVTIPLHLKAD